MGSQSVAKAVAKKLKYYVDIKRREDAFDLTGPFLPPEEPMPHRPGPTLAYDGIHDRSLKHYFRDPDVKTQVGKMTISSEKSYRESEIRRLLDAEMATRNYKLSSDAQSPYLSTTRKRNTPPRHRPQALISVDEYLKTRKGSKQRKVKSDFIGKPRKAVRRSPPQFVSKNEHERLVNMAARLIAATETAALPGNRYSQTTGEPSTCDSSQLDVQSYNGESSETEISSRRCPRPPSRAGVRPPRWTPPRVSPVAGNGESKRGSLSKSSNNSAQSDTSENVRGQVKQRRTAKNKKEVVSPYNMRPSTAGKAVRKKPLEPSLQHTPYRPQSARFENSKSGKKNGYVNGRHMVNSYLAGLDDELNLMNNEQQFLYRRSPKPNVARVRTLTYEVFILTGDRRGAGTEADIKLTLFGEYGTSGERQLLKSMNHSRKFQRGQVDVFPLDSLYLGELQSVRVGHTRTTSEHGWFLEKIYISEGKGENRVFQFPCQRWFSSQKDDGQIVRDVCVSGRISETKLNDTIDEYSRRAPGSSDDESDASYTSDSSANDDEKRKYSSDNEDRTPRDKTKGDRKTKGGKRSENGETNKAHETRKKTVSFEGERANDEHDSDKEAESKAKKSEDEYSSGSEKSDYSSDTSDTEDEKERGKKSEGENSDGESSDSENSKGKSSEGNSNSKGKSVGDKSSKSQNSKQGKSSEGENSGSKNSEDLNQRDDDSSENKKDEDDFWSASSDKGEPIHYDLGVEDEEKHSEKEDSNHSGSPRRSRSSSSASSRHSESEKEEETKPEESESREKEDKEENDDKQRSQESVRSAVKSDEEASKDYMAGFVAGVKATEHEKEIRKEDEHHSDEEQSDEDDEEHIMRKGPSLHVAVSTGNTDRVKELIQLNPTLKDHTDEKGWIPLHVGCSSGQLECVKLIAVSGGNLEQETPTGYTSMHLAAMNGHVNCMMVLFALGAEISCRTIDEHTPLHLAAMSGHVECVKWLLANRARHDVKDVNGRTPSDIAEEYCYEDVAELLKSFKKELTRSDSTLSHLMTYEGKRRKSVESVTSETAGTSSKVADSGVGGEESGEENWVSDNDDDEGEEDAGSEAAGERPSSGSRPTSGRRRPGSARRPSSARSDDSVGSRNRTDSITTKEEKQKLYERQRQQMKKRNSSFLDSIRMDVEDDFNTNF